jgi:hypothetical protein
MLKYALVLFSLFVALGAHASIYLGTGYNNATGGRVIPSLNIGAGGSTYDVLISSTGVSTKSYSHSAYSVGGYWTKNLGDFLTGKIKVGYGFGASYAHRTFQDLNQSEEKKTDLALGPAFFSRWYFIESVFISVEAILGLGDPGRDFGDMLAMNVRDQVNFSLGVEF